MNKPVKNLPVSILSRLRKKAQAEGRNAQDLLRFIMFRPKIVRQLHLFVAVNR